MEGIIQMKDELKKVKENIEKNRPLVHNITNYVTVNDCANIQLAFDGSPIMADSILEVEEVVSVCSSLVINIGTINERTIESMIRAGEMANIKEIPVILDPVGYGFTKLRTDGVDEILSKVKVSVIKGNISEIKGLLKGNNDINGVDVSTADKELTKEGIFEIAKKVSKVHNCVVAVTSKVDVVTDGKRVVYLSNGNHIMSDITGTGCMISALLGVSLGGNKENIFMGTTYGVGMMGVCGEIAANSLEKRELSRLKNNILDKVGSIKFEEFMEVLNYEYN
ncbi:hydroxyethylthiazole kinase [Psychrilyobacter atlanticus]|uniref:hydroxyethylthiazole kinase n=1 Tax=Psychrilyobacter atlanticus TaxID=271091 RepID=UPI00040B0B60|nr:hydroxyethylthiazole kinase [Psychrilyobacter atlanticus]